MTDYQNYFDQVINGLTKTTITQQQQRLVRLEKLQQLLTDTL